MEYLKKLLETLNSSFYNFLIGSYYKIRKPYMTDIQRMNKFLELFPNEQSLILSKRPDCYVNQSQLHKFEDDIFEIYDFRPLYINKKLNKLEKEFFDSCAKTIDFICHDMYLQNSSGLFSMKPDNFIEGVGKFDKMMRDKENKMCELDADNRDKYNTLMRKIALFKHYQ